MEYTNILHDWLIWYKWDLSSAEYREMSRPPYLYHKSYQDTFRGDFIHLTKCAYHIRLSTPNEMANNNRPVIYCWMEKTLLRSALECNDYNITELSKDMRKTVQFLYEVSDNSEHYLFRWLYLTIAQTLRRYGRSAFCGYDLQQYFRGLESECLTDNAVLEFSQTAHKTSRWIPSGILERDDNLLSKINIKDTSAIGYLLFNEMQYIRANYQMCRLYFDTTSESALFNP